MRKRKKQLFKEFESTIENLTELDNHSQMRSKKVIFTPKELLRKKNLILSENDFNNFNYSCFLVSHNKPFKWVTNSNWNQKFPLRLYNLATNQVENIAQVFNSKYLILSYCWGSEQENYSQSYGQHYQTKLTKLGRKALNKVQATYSFLQQDPNFNTNYIWIDNFCINQTDQKEQSNEVKNQRNYYSNATTTLIAIDAEIRSDIDKNDEVTLIKHILIKVVSSSWFTRSWTFQEGLLSKQTIFMFDDALVDGRKLALHWASLNFWETEKENFIFNLRRQKISFQIYITPLGWSYGAQPEHSISLTLGEAMLAVKHRQQSVLVDKIYSILGLLPYGEQVKTNYREQDYSYTKEDLENALIEAVTTATQQGYGRETLLSWSGHDNSLTFQEMINDELEREVVENQQSRELVINNDLEMGEEVEMIPLYTI